MTISTEEHRRRFNSSISDFVQAAVANKRPNYQRLIDQALQGAGLNEQAISLDAVVTKLAQVVGGLTTAKTRRAGEQASQQLFKQLSARLFEQKLLKLFVEIYANLIIEKRSTISYADVLSKVEEFRGDYSKLDSEERFVLGRYWFIQQVLELAGKDFSYAMNFALCLLEAFTEGLRSFLIHGHSSSKYYPGGDCAQRLVYLSAATIPRNKLSMRGWLDRLLEGLNQDNDALDEVLHSIILVLTYEYRDSKFALYIYDPTMEEFGSSLETPRASRPVFWITSMIEPYFRKWASRYDALGKARKTQVKAVLDRFQREKERMVETAETQRRAILERPKRALRPAGYDHVEIGVTPLYYSGIRSVAFHTEGYDFPDMELHFIVRKEPLT